MNDYWKELSIEEREKLYHQRWRTFSTFNQRKLTENEIEAILSFLATTTNDAAFAIGSKLIGHIAYLEQQ